LQIKNTLIADNVAQNSYNHGTVIYTDEGDDESGVLMEHVTIANNSGSENYKPLHLGYSHIVNSIIWGNTSPEDMVISRDNDAEVFIQYSLVQNGEALENFDDGLTIDPRFTDTGNGDYTLSLASFALGAGTDEYENPITEDDLAISGTDLAGNDRIQPADSDPDMGAYESSNALSPYPNPPSNLSADEKHQAVDLSWTAPFDDDVVKYFVYQADSTSSGWSSWAAADTLDSLTSTATTITGLTNGRLYSFYVTSIDTSDYESVASNAVKAVPEYFGPVWYVDAVNGSSNGEGSPENSYKEIQSAIDKTDPLGRTDDKIDTVLVLPGTYDDSDDRELHFKYTFGSNEGQPKNIVLKSRDGAATTILNGGNKRVFELVDQTDTTLHIIGFTITATNGGENDGDGSVIKIHGQSYWQGNQEVVTYSGATFKNCIIKDIDGEDSAVELYYGSAIFNDCEIFGNTFDASNIGNDAFGGAIRVGNVWTDGGSRVYFNRCKLVNNTITTDQFATIHGGALAIGGSNQNYVKMVNSIVAGNIVSFENTDGGYPPSGGAIKFRGGILQLINCTVANNQIITDHNQSNNSGSAIHSEDYNNEGDSPQLTIYNSIVYGNTTVTNASSSPMTDHTNQIYADDFNSDGVDIYASYSLFGGDDDLGGDDILLNTSPEFADTTFVLHERSPAIGAGATASIDAQGETIYAPSNDLAGNTRPNPAGSDPDLGAYEHELDVTLYPNPPSNLSADEKHQAVDLSWTAPFDDDVVKYYVYQSADSTNWTVVDTLDSLTSTTTEIIGLTNDEDYWFYVTSIDTSNYESVSSNEVKTTPHYLGPVWYVDEEEGSSGGEGSLEDPATYIRDMIEMAANGDTILVMPGTYTGSRNRNLDFQYNHDLNNDGVKNLVLKSAYGPDTTIIDVNGQDFIDFTNNEDNSSKIIGFTITNSNFGAVEIMNSSPEIDNCIFLFNQNNQNGGAINISETNGEIVSITNTLFDGNSIQTGTSSRGGAIMLGTAGSMAYVENCIFYNNSSDEMGGAINQDNSSHLVIVQSLFVNNTTNSSWGAGGVNSFAAMSGGYTTIINSIFSGNTNTSGSPESDVYSSNAFEIDVDHCILQSEINAAFNYGENYALDPFINDPANGDFSLGDFSNAIGLGTDEYYNPLSDDDENMPATDFSGAARPQPEGSNPDLGPIEHWRGEPRRYVYLVNDTTGNDISGDGLITPFKSIQKGLFEAAEFDTVEVAAGTYKGVGNKDLHFMDDDEQITRRIVLRSADGPETTIIDCEDNGRGFDIADLFDSGTKVIGFTVTNGSAVDGGAVYVDNADVEFSNMILEDNNAGSGNGGAVYVNNGYVGFLNCIITENTANKSGAVYVAGGEVGFGHNTIVGNHSSDDVGLTVESGSLEIHNSIIWRNSHAANEVEAIGAGELEVNHSIVYGSADGDGIYTGRPGFTDGSNDDFSLLDWSPAIGRADTSEHGLYGQYDIFGNVRTYSDSTWGDLGAIENTLNMADLSLYTYQTWYADTAGVDSSADGSITDPFGTIQHAADYALYTDEVMMNAGTYNQDFTNRGKDIIFRSSNDPSEVTINGVAKMDGGSPQLSWLTFSGAGAEIEALDSDVNIYNVEISSVGDGSDAALDVSGGNPVLYQVTFADNSDDAIHVADSANVTAHNIAFYSTGSHWESAPGCTISVTYSLTDSSGTGNIAVDPGFLGVDNYKLAASSLLINAGDIANTDADGSRSDIGAYPYNNDFNGPIWYVTTAGDDTSGTGSNDSPFASVQAAINFATTAGDSIAVGSGTFTENVHFRGRQVKVHGTGYYSTVIDGGSAGSVVHFDGGEDQSTVLADMTLENGSADYGGGIYAYNASPILKNLYISDNYAATGGGGINLTTNSNPSLTNVIIANNSTGDHGGGIVFHDSSDASLDRVTVADNSANVSGNGLWLWGGSSPSVTNSIIWNGGSEIELSAGSPVTNSITVTYSDVNGSYTGTGNINDDPLFTDASNEDYSLQITSPCIDAGDPSFIYDADSTVVDMGA
jgi:hypothetical protein